MMAEQRFDLVALLLGGHPGPAGHLEWGAPDWVVFVAAAAALVAWAASWLGERPWWARIVEATLWALALGALVAAIARPVWVEEEGRREPARVAVLVDASRSMGILENGTPRGEAADELIERLDGADVDFYQFGPDLAIGRPSAYTLPGTDLESALVALSERQAGEELAAVVVVTDGIDRGYLRDRYKEEERPAPPPELPGPLTVYQVGSPGDLRDLSIRSVDSGGYAFVRSAFRITAHVEGLGYESRTVPATLLRDGAPVTSTKVTLDEHGKGEVVFEVRPDVPGRFTYAVSLPVYDDDAVPANNLMPLVVRVVRDRIRVLQVAGTPTWDVKFLRRFLKGDPSVDLVSFFILRTNADIGTGYDENELSLIAFPHERLFSQELSTFDLVIFQNFDYKPYFNTSRERGSALLANVRDYVQKEGHAFAMIGGDRSFDLGEYANTPLAEILPVELGVSRNADDRSCRGLCTVQPFVPALTEEGRRHPITRLAQDSAENELWWSRLHPADGANLSVGAAPDAAVLLTHPSQTTPSGAPLPILAVREAGAGRSMALAIDSSWRWSFSEAAQGRGNQAYLRFWKNAFRWLVGDPTASRVTVETPRENYGLGDTVRVVVRARDPGFAPLPGARVKAVVQGEGGATPLEGWTGPDGEVALEWDADRRGAQRVRAVVTLDNEEVGVADTVFAVTTRDPELDEVIPDAGFLKWLAASREGKYYAPGEWGPFVRDPEAGRIVLDRRETALWRAPVIAVFIALCGGTAWIVRRRVGLR